MHCKAICIKESHKSWIIVFRTTKHFDLNPSLKGLRAVSMFWDLNFAAHLGFQRTALVMLGSRSFLVKTTSQRYYYIGTLSKRLSNVSQTHILTFSVSTLSLYIFTSSWVLFPLDSLWDRSFFSVQVYLELSMSGSTWECSVADIISSPVIALSFGTSVFFFIILLGVPSKRWPLQNSGRLYYDVLCSVRLKEKPSSDNWPDSDPQFNGWVVSAPANLHERCRWSFSRTVTGSNVLIELYNSP